MYRLLICLPVCLCLAPGADVTPKSTPFVAAVKDDGAPLVKTDAMERLAKTDVLAFYDQMLKRYQREVKGYSATFAKQEFIDGKLYPTEVIDIQFRESPHSVYMEWKQGARQASRVLYVEDEKTSDKLLVQPTIAPKFVVVERPVDGAEARASGRYTARQFGVYRTANATLTDWRAAKEAGDLQVEYLGIKKVKEAGDRPCYTLRRTCKTPDKAGVTEGTMYVDVETWLQVGTVLKDEKGNLLGSYFFRDLKLNPDFKKDQFERAALTQ